MSDRTCAIEGCDSPLLARGWCRFHYGRWHKHGDPEWTPVRLSNTSACTVSNCAKPSRKLGMCGKHYQRFTRHGSTDLPPRVYRMCDGPECSRRAGTSGLCRSHYAQRFVGKPLTPLQIATKDLGRPATCVFPGCDRPHKARGYCKSHNEQVNKAETLRPVVSPVSVVGQVCLESSCDAPVVARSLCRRHIQLRYDLTTKYNLTLAQYEALLAAQGGVCAICQGVNSNGYRLSIDHDHACCSGERSCGRCVRALLCAKCNFILGHANDDAVRLRAAADFLDRTASQGVRMA